MSLDEHIEEFYKVIQEVLSRMDPEAAQQFVESFKEKMNEQKCTQENTRPSR
jgi:hypothetical protein